MTTRQERAAATREHLVDAGLRLAEDTGLAGMSVNLIVEKAGVAKGTFFHHFTDRAGFLVAVHREFHDRLLPRLVQAAVEVIRQHPGWSVRPGNRGRPLQDEVTLVVERTPDTSSPH